MLLSHRTVPALVLSMTSLSLGSSLCRAAERPPNIVFLYADDLGYGDLGCYGNTKIKTPNLDRLAADGIRFTSFYVGGTPCTASRGALMTGRFPFRTGLNGALSPNAKNGIKAGELTLAEALKERNYATAIVGKWHLGHLPEFLPTRHGFDRYYGLPYSNDMKPTPLLAGAAGGEVRTLEEPAVQATLTARYTDEATKFIAEQKAKPFFLYVPYTMPHTPLAASERFKGKSGAGLLGDVLEELDWSVGEILAALKKHQLEENTLVVFSSDNGAPGMGRNGKLRGSKGSTFEGGIRVPCLVRWTGTIKAGRVEEPPAIMTDWLPTLVKLAGGQLPEQQPIDGVDLGPVLRGTGKRSGDEFFWNGTTIRSGRWKLMVSGRGVTTVQLFDLEADVSEKDNLAEKHPEVVARLKTRLAEFYQKK
jgi:arylsulfatase A-like enzyme